MSNLQDLTHKVIAFRDVRDWKQFHNPKDAVMSLVLEANEVMEHFQWKNAEEMGKHVSEHKDELGNELADVLYWLLVMSHDWGIDLAQAFERKMEINALKYPVDKFKGNHTKYNAL